MTKAEISTILKSVLLWPQKDQEALAEAAREIRARSGQVYRLTDEERAAVKEGLAQADRGEFVSDKKMRAFWKKHGVI